MDDQETAWEEIGGVVPARRESSLPARASSRAALEVRLSDIHDLAPVDRAEFFAEVGPCLTLAMGVGMSPGDQDAWLEAAFIALDGIPIGLLRRGVRAAMTKADHPSKIVPAIVAEIDDHWRWRKENRTASPRIIPPERRLEQPITETETVELNATLARIGAATRFRPDGSRYQVETEGERRPRTGPLRKPTRADYIALGVDPDTLDQIQASGSN